MYFMSPNPLQRQIKERQAGNLKHMYFLRRHMVIMRFVSLFYNTSLVNCV